MLVEFVGISGSGKSTLLKAVRSHLRQRGTKCRDFYKFCANADLKDEANWKKSAPGNQKAEAHRLLSLWEFCARHPELARLFFNAALFTERQRSDCAVVLVYLIQLEQLNHDRLMILADEGLLHRCVAALAIQGAKKEFEEFLEHATYPDALVHIDVTVEVADTRSIGRVPEQRQSKVARARPSPELLSRQSAMLKQTCAAARRADTLVIEIDGNRPVSDNAIVLGSALEGAFGSARSEILVPGKFEK